MSRRAFLWATFLLGLAFARGAWAQPAIDPPLEFEGLGWPGCSGSVDGLFSTPSQLIVVGTFSKIGDRLVSSPAAWDGEGWSALPQPPSGGNDRSYCVVGDRLMHSRRASADTVRIDAWDGQRWVANALPPVSLPFPSIWSMTLSAAGSTLVAEAEIRSAAGGGSRLLRWNGKLWEQVLSLPSYGAISRVDVAANGEILAFGALDSTDTQRISSARLSGGVWSTDSVETVPRAVVYWRDRWVGAWPVEQSEQPNTALLVLEPQGWVPLREPLDGQVQSMFVRDDRLLVARSGSGTLGGSHTWLSEVTSETVIDGQTVDRQGSAGIVGFGCVWKGDLYLGGSFTSCGEVGALNLARIADDHAVSFVHGNAIDNRCDLLVPFGDGFAALGDFTAAGNRRANGIGVFDGSSWTMLPPEPPTYVQDLQEFRGQLVVAGGSPDDRFTASAYDGKQWLSMGDGLRFGGVNDLEVYQGDLIAIGSFLYAGEIFTARTAAWDGTSWRGLDIGVRGDAVCAEVWNGQLIVGGNLSAAGNHDVSGIAAWDGYDWSPLGAGIPRHVPWYSGNVKDLAVYGDQLVAAGSFERAGDVESRAIALWDGVAWRRFAQGSPDGIQPQSINFLLPMGDDLWAHGHFVVGRYSVSSALCRWDGEEWHLIQDGSYLDAGVRLADGRTYLSGEFFDPVRAGAARDRLVRWTGSELSQRGGAPALRLDLLGPNPTNGSLDLRFQLARALPVRYSLHDVTGRRMVSIDSGVQAAGPHSIHIDAESLSLPLLLSGVYFLRLEAGGDFVSRRIVVVR